ncbi:Plastid division protein PDV1 [Spatholobus suberectus]|nr:Plastid division protein PDV1 [Spatholobus suberectus]
MCLHSSIPPKMKWDMQMEEIEAILEKIWDLHDKLSDAIHSISRSHFLTSVKTLKNSSHLPNANPADDRSGFVLVKDFRPAEDDDDSAVREAKSLNAIRTALESLEDQLEFFHTIQTQQRVERDAAIARLEQSRIVLAMRLAEHRGKKYKVIEEALAFVGDVHDASCLVAPDILYGQNCSASENFVTEKAKRSNILINIFVSSFNFVKKSLGLDHMGGIVGNAALVAVSMIALLHLHQVTNHEQPYGQVDRVHSDRTVRRIKLVGSSSNAHSSNLDVLLARG